MDALLKSSAGSVEEMVRVGNLGTFSMQTIYDALVNSSTSTPGGQSHLGTSACTGDEANDSDCSWTMDEENGAFYLQMRRRLDDFSLAIDQSTMTTDVLSRHQRRFVHATAQIMNLGHASLGSPRSKKRKMVIYKTNSDSIHSIPEIRQNSHDKGISWGGFEDLEAPSLASSASQRKRKRLEKLHGGYPCRFQCNKTFDRASERNKHEQAHQPAYTNRYPCNICQRGFRYPKDLRRHSARVHDPSRPILDETYASLASTTFSSSLTYESRLPSETSLTFNSNPTSKDNSPLLVGQSQGGTFDQAAIEPFDLGDAAEMLPDLDWERELNLPFQELAGFDFDQHDIVDDDDEDQGLEMVKVRK